MSNPAAAIALSEYQKLELDTLVRNGKTPQKVALRCRLLLLAHEGVANQSIAQQLDLSRPTILALRAAFAKEGIAAITGIRRRSRRGRVLTPELEQKILDATLKTRPGDGSTHSERSTAGETIRDFSLHRSPSLAAPRCATASRGAVQTLQRSTL
jgi:DNA-binding CsgD family transcriptional regulator